MCSKIRQKQKGATYSVWNNFHPHLLSFKKSVIRAKLIDIIKRALKKFSFHFENICVTRTGFKIIITPKGDSDLSEIMKWIKQMFTQWFNYLFNKAGGTAWRDRFHSKIIESLTELIRIFDNILKSVTIQDRTKGDSIYLEWNEKYIE